jgi:5-(carboxyamino)imidazole ribonucleotide synthase
VHMYGKRVCKPGRKMGHVTVLAPDRSILLERIELVRSVLRVGPQ